MGNTQKKYIHTGFQETKAPLKERIIAMELYSTNRPAAITTFARDL
jgi:hypothetical protein